MRGAVCTSAQDGIPSGQLQDERAMQQFRQADADRSGSISLDEFVAYYHTSCASRARLELRSSLGPSAESESHLCHMHGAFLQIACHFTFLDEDAVFYSRLLSIGNKF